MSIVTLARYLYSGLLLGGLGLAWWPAPISAATSEDGVFMSNRSAIPIRLHRPQLALSDIKRVDFWQTSDQGATWLLVHSVPVDADSNKDDIGYVFRPARDGRYGFRICVHYRDGCHDPEPQSGQQPATSDMLEIDSQKPKVVRFALRQAEQNDRVDVAWAVRDLHPGPQPSKIEWSASGNRWHILADDLGVHGQRRLALPAEARLLRVRARDLAGNQGLSESKLIPGRQLPAAPAVTRPNPPADPSPDPANTTPPPEQPAEESTEQSTAQTPEPSPQSAAPPAEPAPEPSPETPSAASAETADADADDGWKLPSLDALRQAAGTAAPSPAERPAPTIDPATIPRMPDIPEGHREIVEPFVERGAQPRPTPRPVRDNAPTTTQDAPAPQATATPPVEPAPQAPNLRQRDLAQELARARAHARAGELTTAQQFYHALRGTSVARQALPEEMLLLRRLHRQPEALALYRAAPQEVLSAAAHSAHAQVLLDQEQYAQALASVERISVDSTRYEEGRFIRALALYSLGKRGEARAEMRILAGSKSPWGHAAQRWLDGL